MNESSDRRRAVSGYFDRLASTYGEGTLFRARRAAVLGAIAAELAEAGMIVDLGCGNGAFTAELAERSSAPLLGADLSPEMLAAARRRLGANMALVRADAMALPFRRRSFDLVFMSHVLLLLADPGECITQVADCLRPRGALAATVGGGHWRDALRGVLAADELAELAKLFGGGWQPSADEEEAILRACREAGLRAEARSAPYAVTWRDLDEWAHVRWLSIMEDPSRAAAENWLARIGARLGDTRLSFAERVVVARRE